MHKTEKAASGVFHLSCLIISYIFWSGVKCLFVYGLLSTAPRTGTFVLVVIIQIQFRELT